MTYRKHPRHIVLWRRKKPAKYPDIDAFSPMFGQKPGASSYSDPDDLPIFTPASGSLPRNASNAAPDLPKRSTAGFRFSRRIGKAPAAFFAAFFAGILLLPHCPGFERAILLTAGLSGGTAESSSPFKAENAEETDGSPLYADEKPLPSSGEQTPQEEISDAKPQTDSGFAASETDEPSSAADEPERAAAETSVPEILPENEAVLVHKTYTASPSDVYVEVGGCFVKNVTDYGNDTVLAAEAAGPSFALTGSGEVEVLIMHTHTTECYMPYTGSVYDTTYPTRSTDNTENMAAVGEVIADELRAAGIGAIHDTTQHDYPSYNGSYERSAETVKKYLEAYPTIKVVLDIHRDAIVSGSTVTAPVVETDEGTAAQVMIISGCDDGTMDYPNWRENLAFAIDLQQQMEASHPGFTRPVLFDYRFYNQNLTTGSLLLEVGGHGNTLPQALLAGKWIGQSLAQMAVWP